MEGKPIYMSQKELDDVQRKLKEKGDELIKIRSEKALVYTASGDMWHDNPYFNKLEQDEKRITEEISITASLLSRTKLIELAIAQSDKIIIGSKFSTIKSKVGSNLYEILTYQICGYGESDIEHMQIAYNSPLGASFIGLDVGDSAEIALGGVKYNFEVVKIHKN